MFLDVVLNLLDFLNSLSLFPLICHTECLDCGGKIVLFTVGLANYADTHKHITEIKRKREANKVCYGHLCRVVWDLSGKQCSRKVFSFQIRFHTTRFPRKSPMLITPCAAALNNSAVDHYFHNFGDVFLCYLTLIKSLVLDTILGIIAVL